MSDFAVRYRPRAISKVMLVIFVTLLLTPALVAVGAALSAVVREGLSLEAVRPLKVLYFVGGPAC